MQHESQIEMYRVEISGWDHQGQFFVEHSMLEWRQDQRKSALIRRRVRSGTLLFLRLLDRTNAIPSFPVAYRVRDVRAAEGAEKYEVQLAQMWPVPQAEVDGTVTAAAEEKARGYWMGIH
jgi:hypothetical protein